MTFQSPRGGRPVHREVHRLVQEEAGVCPRKIAAIALTLWKKEERARLLVHGPSFRVSPFACSCCPPSSTIDQRRAASQSRSLRASLNGHSQTKRTKLVRELICST